MSDLSLFFMLLAALAIGWLLGRLENNKKNQSTPFPSMDMLAGDQHSETMQAILNMAEREEAVELQLNLGTFYRRRGEIDKAISIHQGLFARPGLDKKISAQVQLALASDYLNAGLFDRAERLLLELHKSPSGLKEKVLNKLVTLYEEEQEWQKILDLAHTDKSLKGSQSVAYACCELADAAIEQRKWRDAQGLIKQALKYDGQCVRALLLEAKMAGIEGFPNKVLSSIKEALMYEPGLLHLVFPQLQSLFKDRHRPQELEKLLMTLWHDAPTPLALQYYVQHLAQENSIDDAISQLTQFIATAPSIEGFSLLLNELIEKGEALPISYLQHLKEVLEQLHTSHSEYQCRQCGFQSDRHYWRCPSCKQWQSSIPKLAMSPQSKAVSKEGNYYAK